MARQAGTFRRGLAVVWRHARGERWLFVLSLAGAILYSIAAVGTTVVLGRVTEDVLVPSFGGGVSVDLVRGAALALVLVAVLRVLGIVLRRYCAGLTRSRSQATLRRQVVDRYLEVPLAYNRSHPTGELIAHADADVLAATEVLNALPFTLGVLVLIAAALVSLLVVDPVLALVAVLLFPALAVMNRVYTARVERPSLVVQQRVGDVTRIAHESFDGALVVKTLGRAPDEVERFDRASAQLQDARVRVGRIRATFEPAIDALPNLGVVVLLLVGAFQIDAGRIDTGDLVQAMALFGLLAFPMRVVGYFLEELPRAVVATDRIDAVLAAEPEPGGAGAELPPGPLGIELDHVVVRYGDHAVLDGITATIEPAEVVAIVGRTGSGKSTVCELLPRLADPTAGVVRVGGVDVTEVDLGALRRTVALVLQEPFLFADTVRENLTLGAAVDDRSLDEALARARALEFVHALPNGFDTVVGERGVTLSGGQRQRLALARALARDPRVLVLDDATSAVDPVVEAEILRAIGGLRITTLIVAHRVSTIRLADRVLYLAAGGVRAMGTHDELLAIPDYEAIVRAYERGEQP